MTVLLDAAGNLHHRRAMLAPCSAAESSQNLLSVKKLTNLESIFRAMWCRRV
jgi:hypothetical protein